MFDFGWAQAYARHGLRYYPKLLCAVPFTPATGPAAAATPRRCRRLRAAASPRSRARCDARGLLVRAALFVDERDRDAFERPAGCCAATASSTGTTAATPTSRPTSRRSPPRSARRRGASGGACAENGIAFRTLHGDELDAARSAICVLRAAPAAPSCAHGHEPYLSRGVLPRDRAAARAAHDGEARDARQGSRSRRGVLPSDTTAVRPLLGRARATSTACISRPAITRASSTASSTASQRFEPGTQGEHKVARGFEPTLTWSAHYVADPRFREAHRRTSSSARRRAVEAYAAEIDQHTPVPPPVKRLRWLSPGRSAATRFPPVA